MILYLDGASTKLHTDRHVKEGFESFVSELQQQTRLSYAAFANNDVLESVRGLSHSYMQTDLRWLTPTHYFLTH